MNPILWAVVVPFIGAVGCLLARGRGAAWIGGATALAVATVCVKLLVIKVL